ncbi:MAG: hypothetical protein LBN21_08410 [Treponema sp.]|jgi:two-component system phosphate regulon sensor histidine kinase PhoR|nr:hypothetical protein [Treponema sp.]
MRKKIFLSIFAVAIVTFSLGSAIIFSILYNRFVQEIREGLETEAANVQLIIDNTDNSGNLLLAAVGRKSNNRITFINRDGGVIYDSFFPAETLDNHAQRPEVALAFKTGSGSSERVSDTLGERNYYYALRLEDGGVVRIAKTANSMLGLISDTIYWIFLLLLGLFICAFFPHVF